MQGRVALRARIAQVLYRVLDIGHLKVGTVFFKGFFAEVP